MVDLDSLLLGDDRSFVIGLGPQSLPDGSSGKKMPPIFLIFSLFIFFGDRNYSGLLFLSVTQCNAEHQPINRENRIWPIFLIAQIRSHILPVGFHF